MRTRIISAFPGTGKTSFFIKNPEIVTDSDSSHFSKSPEFPGNYIDHIQSCIGKFEFILTSTHKEVREALKDNCLFFYIMCPTPSQKSEYLERYRNRGSSEEFIELLNANWDTWIRDIWKEKIGCRVISMEHLYLEDEIRKLEIRERDIRNGIN